jgi:uncharacterized membrane protein YdjX (TVP38/TMEM64 family)
MKMAKIVHGLSLEWGIALSVLFVALLLGVMSYFHLGEEVMRLFDWLAAMGGWAPLLFIIIDMLVVILLLPGVMVTMGAGFLFGVTLGSLCVVVATTLGATIAFLIARHLLGERTSRYFLSHPRLKVLNDEFAHEGWRVILLTRLIPFFPFKLSNYFFGVSDFTLRDFVLGTAIGVVPFTITNVYLGSLAADLSMLGLRHVGRTRLEWTVYGFGFVMTMVAAIYFSRHAKKALSRYTEPGSQPKGERKKEGIWPG